MRNFLKSENEIAISKKSKEAPPAHSTINTQKSRASIKLAST